MQILTRIHADKNQRQWPLARGIRFVASCTSHNSPLSYPMIWKHPYLYLLVPCLYLYLQFNAHSVKHRPSRPPCIDSDYFKRIAAIGKWNGCYAKCVFYKNQLIHVKMKVGFIRKLTDSGPKVVVAQGLALWVGSTGNSCGCPLLMLDHLWPVQKACLLTNGNWVCVFVCAIVSVRERICVKVSLCVRERVCER